MGDLAASIRKPVSKVIAVGDPPRPDGADRGGAADVRRSRRAPPSRTRGSSSSSAPGVSKGRAVAWLAHRAGIPMSQVMTAGDALNDLEMIGDAGHGAAMASAPAVVRAAGAVRRGAGRGGRRRAADRGAGAGAARRGGPQRRAAGGGGRRDARRRGRLVTTTRILPDGDAARAEAVDLLRAGRIVAIPTDTVYGIAADLALPGRDRAPVRRQAAPAREGRGRAARRRRPGLVARGRDAGRRASSPSASGPAA